MRITKNYAAQTLFASVLLAVHVINVTSTTGLGLIVEAAPVSKKLLHPVRSEFDVKHSKHLNSRCVLDRLQFSLNDMQVLSEKVFEKTYGRKH